MWHYLADLVDRSAERLHFLSRVECMLAFPSRKGGLKAPCLGPILHLDVIVYRLVYLPRSARCYPQRVRELPSSMVEN